MLHLRTKTRPRRLQTERLAFLLQFSEHLPSLLATHLILPAAVAPSRVNEMSAQYIPLDVGRLWKVHGVDSVHHILGSEHAATEPTTIETLEGVLATLYTVKLDVDFAIIVVESQVEVDDFAVLLLALSLDVLLEVFRPVWLSFPATMLAHTQIHTVVVPLTRSGCTYS